MNSRTVLTMAERELEASNRNLAEIEVRLAEARAQSRRAMKRWCKQQLISETALDTSQRGSERAGRATRSLEGAGQSLRKQLAHAPDRLQRPRRCALPSRAWSSPRTRSPARSSRRCPRRRYAHRHRDHRRHGFARSRSRRQRGVHQSRQGQPARRSQPRRLSRTSHLPAHVINIVPTADRTKATVRVRIGFDKLEPQILPDMGIKVRFLDDAPRRWPTQGPRVRVPSVAVQRRATAPTSGWLATAASSGARSRPGAENDGQTEVLAGVRAGEELVAPVVEGPRGRWQGQAQGKQ